MRSGASALLHSVLPERVFVYAACRTDPSYSAVNVKEGPDRLVGPFFRFAFTPDLLAQVRPKEIHIPIARWGVVVLPQCTSTYSVGYARPRRVTTGLIACADSSTRGPEGML